MRVRLYITLGFLLSTVLFGLLAGLVGQGMVARLLAIVATISGLFFVFIGFVTAIAVLSTLTSRSTEESPAPRARGPAAKVTPSGKELETPGARHLAEPPPSTPGAGDRPRRPTRRKHAA
jgi:hypothetical protein